METRANLNISIIVHEARLDSSINSLCFNSQILLSYNGISLKTKTKTEFHPIWEESFNFEYSNDSFEIILFHNPLIFKEIILGKSVISVNTASGWFILKNHYGKIGSIRITINKEETNDFKSKEFQLKYNQLLLIQDDVKRLKEKYLNKIKKLKDKKQKLTPCLSNKDFLSFSYRRLKRNQSDPQADEIIYMKNILQLQEEKILQAQENIKNEWREIEIRKKEIENMRDKIKNGYEDLQNLANITNNVQNTFTNSNSKSKIIINTINFISRYALIFCAPLQ